MAETIKPSKITIVDLEKIKFSIQEILSQSEFSDMDSDVFLDYIKNLVVRLDRYIWSEILQNDIIVKSYPKNVWQFFKSRFLPSWLIKIFPVKYENVKIEFKRRALFPDFKYYSDRSREKFIIQESIDFIMEE